MRQRSYSRARQGSYSRALMRLRLHSRVLMIAAVTRGTSAPAHQCTSRRLPPRRSGAPRAGIRRREDTAALPPIARAVGWEPHGAWYHPLPSMSHHFPRGQVSFSRPPRALDGWVPACPRCLAHECRTASSVRGGHLHSRSSSRPCGSQYLRGAARCATARV